MLKVMWSYIKELIDSFFDDNLKKMWAIFKGTFVTLFTVVKNPCYLFPLPKKHLLDEISKMEETDEINQGGKDGFVNDINFTKNAILIMITLVIGDAATNVATEEDNMITKILSVGFYLIGFLIFLVLGRLWGMLFADTKLKIRRLDGWFSLEYNTLFLLFFIGEYIVTDILGFKESGIIIYATLLIFIHVIYFMISLQKQAKKEIGGLYYWGVSAFLVIILTVSVAFTGILQTVLKDDSKTPKTEKKIEQKAKPETEEKAKPETEEKAKPETEEKTE